MDIPCRSKNVNKYYRVIAEVGSGTYGKVYKAECLKTNDFVALKKIDTRDPKIISEGFPITAIREIKLLKMMTHKNIIRLREIIVSKASIRNNYRGNKIIKFPKGSTFLVFDYMDHDFAGLHRMKNTFGLPQLKCIFKQILEGVKYLHENRIIHRDLKSANLLLNNKGEVSIADFGLARTMSILPNAKYTYKVVTLWYRAPELLMGQSNYTSQIDLWSVGCIFAELLTGDVLFKGDTEYRQMEKIYEICGSATEYNWPECVKLRQYEELKPRRNHERVLQKHLRDSKPNLDQYSLDILDNLLVLDPSKRLTAVQALNHDFFKQDPKPCSLKEMPHLDKEFHETLFKNEMKMQQQQSQQQLLQKPKSSQQVTSFNPDKPFQSHGLQRFQNQKAEQQGSLQMLQRVLESKSLIDQRESRRNTDKDRDLQRMDSRPSKAPYKDIKQSSPQQQRQDAGQTVQLDDILESIISRDPPKQDKNISASAAFGIDEEPLLRKKHKHP